MDHDPAINGYNVHTTEDRREMLSAMGMTSIGELFAQVPEAIRLKRPLNLPPPLSEWELDKRLHELAGRNAGVRTHLSLLGGGAYAHYIPAVVPAIATRGEYLTAYTPYQPEMSQGILRVLHDFQIVTSRLLGLPAVNCSVYDGATALAESAWMACSIKGIHRLAVAETLWPDSLRVLRAYMKGRGVTIATAPADPETGRVDSRALTRILDAGPVASVIVQTPNCFGIVESVPAIVEACRARDSLSHVHCYPMMLGCLKNPGEQGADIATAEAQCLGITLSGGGPYLGLIATRMEYERFLPGRIVGECDDIKGQKALALVKENREQHVARDKATSHICSNQANLALRVLVYLSAVGENGFRRLAALNTVKAHYLCARLCAIPGVRRVHTGSFFNEFLLELPCAARPLLEALRQDGIFGGIDAAALFPGRHSQVLIAVTEMLSKGELDRAGDAFARRIGPLREGGQS